MKEKITTYTYCLLACVLLFFAAKGMTPPDPKINTPINWETLKTVGVQQGGRTMPLDSFSRVILVQFSGKSTIKANNKKLSSIEWLARTIFEKSTDDYPAFLIENPRIVEALKMEAIKIKEKKDDRDWYTYNHLKDHMNEMAEFARQAAGVEQEKRDLFQNQIINLHNNVSQFQDLRNTFSFWEPKKGMTGTKKFYKELVPILEKIYSDNNLQVQKFYRDALLEVISYRFNETNEVSISEYLYHLYTAMEIFRQQGMEQQMKDIVAIEESLHNKEIRENFSNLLTMIPPLKDDGHEHHEHDGHNHDHDHDHADYEEWRSPWYIFYAKFDRSDERKEGLFALNGVHHEFQKREWTNVNASLLDLSKFYDKMLPKDTISNLKLEETYNRYDFFFYSMILYLLGTLYCLASWLGFTRKSMVKASVFLLILAYGFHTAGITMRMVIKARPPVSTLYESILFAAWVGVTITMIMEYLAKESKSISLFIGNALGYVLLAIAGKYAMDGDNMAVLVAVLDSNFWLSTHVTSMIIGYSTCMVAGGIGHIYIFMNLVPNMDKKKLKEAGKLIYGTLCFGAIIAFLGTILGGLWADQSWGRFWGWDPKENGAMLIVLWTVILLHSRLGGYIRDWGLALGAIFGNIVVAAAWWGVNLLSVGLHNYGFTQGLFNKLMIFTFIEIAFIAFGAYVCWNQKVKAKQAKIA